MTEIVEQKRVFSIQIYRKNCWPGNEAPQDARYSRQESIEVRPLVPKGILSVRQTVKETIGVGVNEKAALSSDKNCPFVYINFDFTLVNKVASL